MMGLFSFFSEEGKGCSAVINKSALVYEVIACKEFNYFCKLQPPLFSCWLCFELSSMNKKILEGAVY